jgi:glutamate-1-semialdehyde 2,1-aminomutase
MNMTSRNQVLFEASQRLIPGGVNSPVRAFRSVGGTPIFFARASGSRFWDVDGKAYIDYVGSWGPLILGHAHPEVVEAVRAAAGSGLSYGAPTEAELDLATLIQQFLPSMEMMRLVSSGTEATMTAIRLARGFTGRSKIIKFEGCYHGHADALLVKAGSGALTLGQPSSAGVPPETAAHTLVLSFNDVEELKQTFAEQGDSIATVIVEPVPGNMNLIHPAPGYLELLRELCTKHGTVLIFDEVMTGFRVNARSAQGLFGIKPDLTTLGKVVGGGMPLAVFGGRRDIMQCIAPLGPVYQAGTLSGNPIAVAAGLATLRLIGKDGFFEQLTARTHALVEGISRVARECGEHFSAQSVGAMFGLYYSQRPPASYTEVMASNREQFNRFFHGMLDEGIYLAPSAFEAGFVSAAHSASDIEETIAAARRVFAGLAAKRTT